MNNSILSRRGARLIATAAAMLGFGGLSVSAATYYVNSTDGSDLNSGLSPSLAWQTLAKVSASSWTQKGSGSDIGGTADSFNYGYQSVSGDATIIVRLNNETGSATADKR